MLAKNATPQLLLGEQCKPAFDEVEPGGARRREVELKAWTLQQSALNGRSLVSTVVVEDQMDVKLWRHLRVNLIQELTKLQRAMTAVELANHLASLSVQSSEQRSRLCRLAETRALLSTVGRSPAFPSWASTASCEEYPLWGAAIPIKRKEQLKSPANFRP